MDRVKMREPIPEISKDSSKKKRQRRPPLPPENSLRPAPDGTRNPQPATRNSQLALDAERDALLEPLPPEAHAALHETGATGHETNTTLRAARTTLRAALEAAYPNDPERQLFALRQILRSRANTHRPDSPTTEESTTRTIVHRILKESK